MSQPMDCIINAIKYIHAALPYPYEKAVAIPGGAIWWPATGALPHENHFLLISSL